MTKKGVMITIDEGLHKKAKDKMINISAVAESALRMHAEPVKSDAPNKALQLKCTRCYKKIEYGFLCKANDEFLCQKCQDKWPMHLCKHDKQGYHEHIRIPSLDGKRESK